MTEALITYILVGILAVFAILSFAIGLEKMIKIILGNYIIGGICFAASASIDLASQNLGGSGFIDFLFGAKATIILLLYVGLLFLIYHKSKITINIPGDQILQKSMYLFFVPLTVISMLLTLEIILLGTSVLNQENLVNVLSNFTDNIYIQKFILNTPYWILLHGIATIFITSEFRTKLKTDI